MNDETKCISSNEINFDGLVGPTHNYGGLSAGNLASMQNIGGVSNPRAAVLQGISKMRALLEMGLKQGVLPPHERVHIPSLRRLGFAGTDKAILERAWKQSPALVTNLASASAMCAYILPPPIWHHCSTAALKHHLRRACCNKCLPILSNLNIIIRYPPVAAWEMKAQQIMDG